MTVSPNDLTWVCDPCYGTLAVGGFSLSGMGICVDLSDLWASPEVRGSNTPLPGVPGVAAEPYRPTETRYSLPLHINGHWSHATGVALVAGGNIYAQLEANVAWLYANVVLTDTATDVTQTAVWTLPSGGSVVAEVQVLRVPPPTLLPGAVMRSTLELRVPGADLHL